MGWNFFHGEVILCGFFGCSLRMGCGWSKSSAGTVGKAPLRVPASAGQSAQVLVAAGPAGPPSLVSLRPIETVERTSSRVGPPAKGCEMASAMAIGPMAGSSHGGGSNHSGSMRIVGLLWTEHWHGVKNDWLR